MSSTHFTANVAFTPLKKLATIISFCGVVTIIAISTLATIFYIGSWAALSNNFDVLQWLDNPFLHWLIGMENTFILIAYAGIAVFLIWLYQAYRNLYALDLETATTPGIVVAESIIPVVNLWGPYIRVREIWQKVVSATDWQLVKVWWGALIIGGIASAVPRIVFVVFLERSYPSEQLWQQYVSTITFFYSVATISLIAAIVILLKIIYTISAEQEEKIKHVSAHKEDHALAIQPDDTTVKSKRGIMSTIMLACIIAVLAMLVLIIVGFFLFASRIFH